MAQTRTPEPELGSPAPDFDLAAVDGTRHTLAGVRGPKGLLVMFICNHCPYVQALRDRMVGDMRELQDAGIGVVAICANDAARYPEDSPAMLLRQAREWSFSFPYLHDATQEVARAYGAVCTPDFFGYDADLRLRYRGRLDSAQRNPRTPQTRRELVDAMLRVARGEAAPETQEPSIGCSIKWAT